MPGHRAVAGLALLWVLAGGPARAATFPVNSTGDQADNNIGNGTCSIGPPTNACTLRAALQEANFTAAADTIDFGIGAAGSAQTIAVLGVLPTSSVSADSELQNRLAAAKRT